MKTDVNVPSKSNKQKIFEKTYFLLASRQPLTKKKDPNPYPDPHPCQNFTDPHSTTVVEVPVLIISVHTMLKRVPSLQGYYAKIRNNDIQSASIGPWAI